MANVAHSTLIGTDLHATKTASVGTGELKTTTGEVSVYSSTWGDATLPGGTYGFYPQIKMQSTDSKVWRASVVGSTVDTSSGFVGWTSYVTNISMIAGFNLYIYAQQRYITASGKDHWIFLLVDKITKQVIASYQAPDHPCANQGGATELDIPHPFGSYDPEKHEIVVVDNDILNIAKTRINRKRSLLTVINEDFIIDDTQRPIYEPREIIKINEYPDEPIGIVKARIKTPQGAKILIQPDEVTLEQRIIEKLPANILFKKMVLKR